MGLGVPVGVTVGFGVEVGVTVGFGVEVTVGFGVEVTVGFGVEVTVGFGVEVGVGVGVGIYLFCFLCFQIYSIKSRKKSIINFIIFNDDFLNVINVLIINRIRLKWMFYGR